MITLERDCPALHLKRMVAVKEREPYSMTFSEALVLVKIGLPIQRKGWNGSGLVVKAQFPDENSKMTLPYLYIEYPMDAKTTPGARCPWLASQTDIMANDWSAIA